MTQDAIEAYSLGWRAGYGFRASERRRRNKIALFFAAFIIAGAAVGAALALLGVQI